MKVPLAWLKEFVEIDVDPARLARDLTQSGLAVDAVEQVAEDTVLELDITTNRVDCMNVYGVAREVSALYRLPLKPPDLSFPETALAADAALDVSIEAPELCPRFCARVLDVRIGPAPEWLRARLILIGVRPINNLVDLTNYAMMELGHPSHAFDLARIPSGRLVVRWARQGERLTTLDGVERKLTPQTGVVAGSGEPLALAGIMGGASSEISEATRTLALEAAYWDPLSIRRAAKRLGMRTEASHRFERGADPEGPLGVTARIAHLLHRIGAGTVRAGLIDRHPTPQPRRTLVFRPARTDSLLGVSIPVDESQGILERLGFGVEHAGGAAASVTVPSWRGDVAREADLVEEVARHYGLARIPSTIPASRGVEGLRPSQARERSVRRALVGAGLSEVILHAFVGEAAPGAPVSANVALENPISEEQAVLRHSLVSPGLLACLEANLRQGRRDLAIFEMGRVFLPEGNAMPSEERRLGILLAGTARARHWSENERPADFFDVKGLLESVWTRLGLGGLEFEAARVPALLHPGRSASVCREGVTLGYAGALHPAVARARELRDAPVVAEVSLEGLLAAEPGPERFEPLDRFPAVVRDLSILCDGALSFRTIEERIRAAGGAQLRGVTVQDRYDRPPLAAGKLSLTVSLRYQDASRTLTGEEVQASLSRVVDALRGAGAEIRGE